MERKNTKARTSWHFRLVNDKNPAFTANTQKGSHGTEPETSLESFFSLFLFFCLHSLFLHSAALFTAICFTLSDMGSCFLLRSYCPRLNLIEITKAFFYCIFRHWAELYLGILKSREPTKTEEINKSFKDIGQLSKNIITSSNKFVV